MTINLFAPEPQPPTVDEFVKTYREFIDAEIRKAYPADKELTDSERKEWVFADAEIHAFARSLGMKV